MNAKILNFIFFAAGAVIGALASAKVTQKVVTEKCQDECDKELNDQMLRHREDVKDLKVENQKLKDYISDKDKKIDELMAKIAGKEYKAEPDDEKEEDRSDSGGEEETEEEVIESERRQYWRPAKAGEITEEAEIEETILAQHPYYRIAEEDFDTTALDYSKEELRYYIYDGKVLNEDGEWLDDYARYVGDEWTKTARNGEYIFVRNDYYTTDYRITFHADFGEGHMTISSEDWED